MFTQRPSLEPVLPGAWASCPVKNWNCYCGWAKSWENGNRGFETEGPLAWDSIYFVGPTVVKHNTNTASTSLFLHLPRICESCFKDPREEQDPSEMAEWNMGSLHEVLSFYICCTILPYDVSLVVAQHTPMPLQDYLLGAHSRRK